MLLRKAKLADVDPMHRLINYYAGKNLMLPRTTTQLYESLRDFTVAIDEQDGSLVGCGALHFYGADLAEVRSLAVVAGQSGKGVGRQIVRQLIDEARALGFQRVCAFTLVPDFFSKLGFEIIPSRSLPEKLFLECIYCPKFNNCDEIAMILYLNRALTDEERRAKSEERGDKINV